MLLSITTTFQPATDLGYLLHKNPANVHEVALSFGRAVGFYPEASQDRCTFALFVEVDPVGLVRGRGNGPGLLTQYVNDRPYAASSLLSVAMARMLGTAMSGTSRQRPDLPAQPLPLTAAVSSFAGADGEALARRLFAPLGYDVSVAAESPVELAGTPAGCWRLELAGSVPLATLLAHLYVLIPVLDGSKHYFVDVDEVEKLLRKGEGWLAAHPERELITARYLKRQRRLIDLALSRLIAEDGEDPAPAEGDPGSDGENAPLPLREQRYAGILRVLRQSGVRSVVDLGCGDGRLLARLAGEAQFERIAGVDVSTRALAVAERRLGAHRLAGRSERVRLLQGALTYRDRRVEGADAAVLAEVIEHVDPARLPALARVVFGKAKFPIVVVTTPNAEFNARFPGMEPGDMRHSDHRFEWTRAEFQAWAATVAGQYGYAVEHEAIGEVDLDLGAPTQMAVFRR